MTHNLKTYFRSKHIIMKNITITSALSYLVIFGLSLVMVSVIYGLIYFIANSIDNGVYYVGIALCLNAIISFFCSFGFYLVGFGAGKLNFYYLVKPTNNIHITMLIVGFIFSYFWVIHGVGKFFMELALHENSGIGAIIFLIGAFIVSFVISTVGFIYFIQKYKDEIRELKLTDFVINIK